MQVTHILQTAKSRQQREQPQCVKEGYIDALSLELTADDIQKIENVFPVDKVQGIGMRDFVFRDGRMGLK